MTSEDILATVLTAGEAGEAGIWQAIKAFLVSYDGADSVLVGMGDDCAVFAPEENMLQVVTTDLLVEDIHFLNTGDTQWALLGTKAMAANLSDLASMGASPQWAVVSIAVPGTMPLKAISELYSGMKTTADHHGCRLIGGDTSRSEKIMITLTLNGSKSPEYAQCKRRDARPGDFVYVTGNLGGARAGLSLLLSQINLSDEDLRKTFLLRHQAPRPRIAAGKLLASRLSRVAIIDVSDSLYHESQMISQMSGVQVEINLETMPLYPGLDTLFSDKLTAARFALFSGEEYELLFTCALNPEQMQNLWQHEPADCEFTCIGRVTEGASVLVHWNGQPLADLNDQTFSHFPTGDGEFHAHT